MGYGMSDLNASLGTNEAHWAFALDTKEVETRQIKCRDVHVVRPETCGQSRAIFVYAYTNVF